MIPRSIKRNLAGLRRRERFIRLAWGAGRWLALAVVLLFICALTDYLIDRERDTPWAVRYGLAGLQAAVALVAGLALVLWPQLRRMGDPHLALLVEEQHPQLGHRLITAVELNRPGARTDGMSDELIARVTHEAERLSGRLRFARVADHRRLAWGALVLAPVALVALVPLLLWPNVSMALLARQALLDREVPRRVHLESATAEVWPAGEKVKVVYRATGPVNEDTTGALVVSPEGQPSDRYELTFLKWLPEGQAQFAVELPPSSLDFEHAAKLGDGRSRRPATVHFVPRPIVTKQEAWVRLPAGCGRGPYDDEAKVPRTVRYELPQGQGDIIGIPGSAVRLVIRTQKPVRQATLEVLGPVRYDPKKADEEQEAEGVQHTVAMALDPSGQEAEAVFDLKPGSTGYRVVVADEYGFVNVPAPRRTLRLVPEEPPQVSLLKDYFGPEPDSDVEGMPVPLGKAIRIPYVANGAYGLGRAYLLYRVLKKRDSGNDPAEEEDDSSKRGDGAPVDEALYTKLPLPEVLPTKAMGPFDPRRGVFQNSSERDAVPFHAVPSPDPLKVLGRTLGGGRFLLDTNGLVDPQGKPIKPEKGSQVKYLVKVYADADPNAGRPFAWSEWQVVNIVGPQEWAEWLRAVLREEEQLRKLDALQRGVFEK
jgi:hypothetical protein